MTAAGSLLLKLEAFPLEAVAGAAFSSKTFSQSGGTLGRVADNDWVLKDEYLSRHHAEFRFADGHFCVIDKGSTGGISVDGKDRIETGIPYRLKSGDRLLIGSFQIHVLIVELDTEPADSSGVERASPRDPVDRVQMTAFGPDIVTRRRPFFLQTIFYPPGREAHARALAELAEKNSQRAQVLLLPGPAGEGERIAVRLHGESRVTIDDAEQQFQWRGELVALQFEVRLPWVDWRNHFLFRVDVDVGGCPIGRCKFRVTLAEQAPSSALPSAYGGLSRYQRAFLSYAAEDSSVVADLAQLLDIQGVSYFLDTLSLRAGAVWPVELRQHIESSDLFLLCWSRHAAKSEWVAREIAWALSTQRQSGGGLPDIRPFLLEGPLIAPPPSLEHLNFSSHVRLHQSRGN